MFTKISYNVFVFYLIIIHLPDFVESLCLIIPNLFIFLIWYLIPSRVIPINWANSFWVISGFAWIVANIFSWVAISFFGGFPLQILPQNTFEKHFQLPGCNQRKLCITVFFQFFFNSIHSTTESVSIAQNFHSFGNNKDYDNYLRRKIIIDSLIKKWFKLHINFFIIYDFYRILESYYYIMFLLHF